MKSILLVDDESRLLNLLTLYLEDAGYHCEKELSALTAIERVKNEAFDLILLDVMMPEMDGWQVCKHIREFSQIPIIMLTARDAADDMVFGLENGADDYITKPFDEKILLARVVALLRRSDKTDGLNFQGISLNPTTFQARVNAQILVFTPKEFELLTLFLENQNQVFSRDHLIEAVWGYTSDVDNRTVDSHIRNLREKLRDTGFQVDNFLKTIYGVGYKWES
ncbi:response regulator transcription factor [Lactococcus sp.]|uniref:response regulator transcription factor n=1 Tax=Lactococcus sp. TaxID=44273 RepID=UPI0035AEDF96